MESRNEFINHLMNSGYKVNREEAKNYVSSNLDKFLYNKRFGETFEVQFDVDGEFEKIFDKHCKSSGKSDTVIGEILRGLMKLCYRYLNDGDEIEVGPYSGIWYGLRERLECPFIAADYGVDWYGYDFDVLSCFAYSMGRDYIKNIALNAIILETFDDFNKKNYTDIADNYDNIINFFVDEDVIKKFKDNGIDITHNFGAYTYPNFNAGWINEFEINSITEDMYITIPMNKKVFKIVYHGNMDAKFELSFDWNEVDAIFEKYGDLLRFLFHKSTIDYKKYLHCEEMNKELEKLGFEIKNRYIVKKED